MKKCGRCKEYLELSDFHKSSSTKDARHTICKACRILYNTPRATKWKQAHRDAARAAAKRYWDKNKVALSLQRSAKYYILLALGVSSKTANNNVNRSIIYIAKKFTKYGGRIDDL